MGAISERDEQRHNRRELLAPLVGTGNEDKYTPGWLVSLENVNACGIQLPSV